MLTAAQFAQRALIVFAIGIAVLLAWRLSSVLLLGFGAIVLAVAIRAGGDALAKLVPIPSRWASMVVVALAAAAIAGLVFLVGDEVERQSVELRERLPGALGGAREWLDNSELGRTVLSALEGADESVTTENAVRTASVTIGIASHILVALLIAIYLAYCPSLYVKGVLRLVPPAHRPIVETAASESASALRRWLLGQLISMSTIGLLTGVGLWIAGVPLAFILGILAGLLEFVPVLGPFVAAVPGILLAMTVDTTTALYATAVYLIVQQLEGAVIMPLAQKWAVQMPPALGLFAVVAFGLLFGIPGILFATPLTVVIIVLVERFYSAKT